MKKDMRKYFAADLSAIAKYEEGRLYKELKKIGFKLKKYISKNGLECYVAKCKDGEVVVFRQSEMKLQDWVNNVNYFEERTPIGKTHGGYYKILSLAYEDIYEAISSKDIIVTGFSQGGGLAIIFDKMIRAVENIKSSYIAFEPPKISPEKSFNNNGVYTVKGNDIVPRIPLSYRPSGRLVFITDDGKIRISPHWWIKLWLSIKDTWCDWWDKNDNWNDLDHDILDISNIWKANFIKINKIL